MIPNTLKNLKPLASRLVMALLFCGGILLGGAEFVGFPWGPLIGSTCWVVLGLMVLRLRGKYNDRM